MQFRDYRDLKVWQKSMELALDIYSLAKELPDSEKFGLASQLQRAAVSIPSNIAEGHANGMTKPFVRHLQIAGGSLAELETQLLLANKLNFVDSEKADACMVQALEVRRMILGLQKSLKRRLP